MMPSRYHEIRFESMILLGEVKLVLNAGQDLLRVVQQASGWWTDLDNFELGLELQDLLFS